MVDRTCLSALTGAAKALIRARADPGWVILVAKPEASQLKSLGAIFLLALAVFAFGLYSDITMTRCVRGTVTAALGLCARGE
ncbi:MULTISPECIES: hypothetical protein [Rhodopseudomonas]|uniref:hypothetical protein n=1 Tax=Rhodopseudomonas TaxID=1073 RepID=UPI00128B44E5|nr:MULTISPECIES: hypothetical protein [Rhodopseudomonas]MDF3814353.1 hypothetical protein [Rhodopseudomonas sp. BAL398]WOK18049.1 hypothetical protein RBJ75_00550 [Rhodopseudomonas sp. BAL398]